MTVAMLMRQKHKAGFDEGWKDGLKIGEENAIRRIAFSMLNLGIPEDKILSATGFSQEQLAELKKGNLTRFATLREAKGVDILFRFGNG